MRNFGKINNAFITLMMEGVINKDRKKINIFNQYKTIIKEDKALSTLFAVYDNINNQTNTITSVGTYLDKNINFIQEHKNLNKKMKPLVKLLTENNIKHNTLQYDNMNIDVAITNLVSKPTAKNINSIVRAREELTKHITNNTIKEAVNTKDLFNEMVNFNNNYSDLNDYEIGLIQSIGSKTDETLDKLMESIIKDTIQLINTEIKNSNIEVKEKLLNAKEKLLFTEAFENRKDKIQHIKKIIVLNKNFIN